MVDLQYYILFWVCILGLCFGSFFNVVILRTLSNESIVFPPSKCPKCNNKLLWWHNIPVLSYILLRGKCYFCKEKISIQYPVVELITMILFGLTFLKFGLSIIALFVIFWISCLIIMTGTDIKEKLVDCNLAIAMGISGIIFNFLVYGKTGVLDSIIGLLIGVIILELIARSGYLFAGTRAMGEADTYVAGALGAIFGKNIQFVLFSALIASMFFILPVFFYNQYICGFNKTMFGVNELLNFSVHAFHKLVLYAKNYYTVKVLWIVFACQFANSIRFSTTSGNVANMKSRSAILSYI